MTFLLIALIVYAIVVGISWYVIATDLCVAGYFWAPWEELREYATLTDLCFSLFLALLPVVNLFFVIMFGSFHLLENVHFDTIYPLRRKR